MHMSKSSKLFSRWLLIPFLLVLHLDCSVNPSEIGLTKESRYQIQNILSDQLLRSILLKASNESSTHANRNNSVDNLVFNLNSFQTELVRKRNAECIFDKHQRFEWSSIKFENFNRTILDKWTSLNKKLNLVGNDNLTSQILYELNNKCIDSSSLVDIFVQNASNYKDFETLLQVVLSQSINDGCDMCHEIETGASISLKETWIYGILFVSLINLSSLCGVFIIPLSSKKFYKKTLMFLIAIAVGSLAGSGFLHLIPQAFAITEDTKYSMNHAYVWKGVVMMGGVYLFYVVEKIMKIIIQRKKIVRKTSIDNTNETAIPYYNSQILESIGYLKTHEPNLEPNLEMRIKNLLSMQQEAKNRHHGHNQHGHSHEVGKIGNDFYSIAPVAWMIIFGDGLHNFIDGLSIGAAFTESILKGISICLAVICEEFPHELGDFAILINAGMSYPVALLFNFLSACCCYAGLIVGISLGENFGANEWIYAIAGGMFLYISLCDMIPELNEMGEEIERDHISEMAKMNNNQNIDNQNEQEEVRALKSSEENSTRPAESLPTVSRAPSSHQNETASVGFKIKILVIQNIGIITGFAFMLIMAIHSESIAFT